jgi:hypothetical protein
MYRLFFDSVPWPTLRAPLHRAVSPVGDQTPFGIDGALRRSQLSTRAYLLPCKVSEPWQRRRFCLRDHSQPFLGATRILTKGSGLCYLEEVCLPNPAVEWAKIHRSFRGSTRTRVAWRRPGNRALSRGILDVLAIADRSAVPRPKHETKSVPPPPIPMHQSLISMVDNCGWPGYIRSPLWFCSLPPRCSFQGPEVDTGTFQQTSRKSDANGEDR